MKEKQNFITVCSASYLHYALSLLESIKEHTDNFTFTIFVSDIKSADLTINNDEDFKIIGIDELSKAININIEKLLLYYDAMEFITTLKMYALYYATEVMQQKKCTFLDADAYLFDSIDDLYLNEEFAVYLSPHILSRQGFSNYPDELELITAGVVNGGLIHINKSKDSKEILEWLIEKTKYYWFVMPALGMYADQAWLSILPVIDSSNVAVLDLKSYNVAYWNLQERPLCEQNGEIILSNSGKALKLFHFSGFQLPYNGKLSKHFNREFNEDTEKVIKKISQDYALSLLKSQEKINALNLKPSIRFSKESIEARIKKAEKLWGVKHNIPNIPKGLFEKIGNKIDKLIKKLF